MTARPIPGGRDPTPGHPPSDPSEAEQATADPLNTEPARLLAIRFGAELRRRRREAGLHQQEFADRIAYHRSYLSQVERGRQVPAEQFAMLCDRALQARGRLIGVFRELAAAREARRREVATERWRERFRGSSEASAEAIAVPESMLFKVAGASPPSSDTSMERRPFVRMVGTFASAAMLDALGVDLLNLLRAMQGSRVSRSMLEETELAVLRFHQLYKELPPTELFPHVQQYLQAVTGLLDESQTIETRRRLCSIAGHLAGLRAWLTFDLGDPTAAHIWFEAALKPAVEAEDEALAGWLLGGRSLIPSYSGDHAAALDLVRRGQSHGSRGANGAVQAWLAALEARAHAGLGDAAAFRQAQDLANNALDRTQPDERRHGMDYRHNRSTSPTTRARASSRCTSPMLPSRSSMPRSQLRTPNTSRPAPSSSLRWPPPTHSNGRSTRPARSPVKRWTFRPTNASGPSPSGPMTCSASWSPGAGGLRSKISASAWWRPNHNAW
jgi:transcriptional regulator with XRE-family HTH domain